MSDSPTSVKAALVLIWINALIWLTFAVIVAADLHPALPENEWVRWIMAGLSLLAAGALMGLWVFLRKRSTAAYWLALAFLVFMALLTMADELGVWDIVVLAVTLAPVALLLKSRAWYLRRRGFSSTNDTD